MVEQQVYLCNLYDYYHALFTERQRQYFEDYYFENLTMEEIALNNHVSKNAVSKALLEIKNRLEELESLLGLYQNKQHIMKILDEDTLNKIIDYI